MNIDDPDLIEEVLSYHPEEIEPIYWVLEDSCYKGDIKLAKSVYRALACVAKHNKPLLRDNLKPVQMTRLKEITFELFGNKTYKERQPITIKHESSPRVIPFEKESELRDYLFQNPKILSDAYGDELEYLETEVKTDFGYRCDIVARSKKYCYPTEIKIGQANHGIVSQIDKYCHYFYRRFRYDMHRLIQGVTIANGYDPYSINELRKNNILCFEVYSSNKYAIYLQKIC